LWWRVCISVSALGDNITEVAGYNVRFLTSRVIETARKVKTMLERLKDSLINSPVIKRGEYNYFIHPISDGVPSIDPRLVEEISDYITRIADMNAIDTILTVEAMGIPVASVLSLKTGVPLTIVRKRPYFLEGEVELSQSTGYSKGVLYINGLKKGDRIIIVDDVISTGGTLLALVKALKNMGVEVMDVISVIGRGDGYLKLKELGVEPKILVTIDVSEKGVEIKDVFGDQ
jgi:adenine phosphoribosyltransferase